MMNRENMYGLNSGVIGSLIDIGILIIYFNAANPTGITLDLIGVYGYGT